MMRHMRDTLLAVFALGQVIDNADQVLRRPVRSHHRQACRGYDSRAVGRSHDRMLVEKCRLARCNQLAVFFLDLFCARLRHDVRGCLSEHDRTTEPQILLGRAVDQQISQVRNALHDDGRRHVLDDPVEERSRALELALVQIAFGNVFVSRHPTAAFHRLVYDGDRAAIFELDVKGKSPALLERLAQIRFVDLWVERKCPRRDARFKQIVNGAPAPDAMGIDTVHVPVSLVPNDQPVLRIEHAQALIHIIEGFIEPKLLLAAVTANLPTQYRRQRSKRGHGNEHRLRKRG